MEFNLKNYQNKQVKNIIKKNNFLLFSIGANQTSQNWMILEQNLYKLSLSYIKIYNNITKKILDNSIFKNLKNSINSTFFFLKPKKNQRILIKSNIITNLNNIQFSVISLKLNKKFYTVPQLKNIHSFHQKKNLTILYQFLLTALNSSLCIKFK